MCAVKSRRESLAVGTVFCDRRGVENSKAAVMNRIKLCKDYLCTHEASEQPPPAMRIRVRVYAMSWASRRHAPTLRQRLDSFT
jgi:hypothetical protein